MSELALCRKLTDSVSQFDSSNVAEICGARSVRSVSVNARSSQILEIMKKIGPSAVSNNNSSAEEVVSGQNESQTWKDKDYKSVG